MKVLLVSVLATVAGLGWFGGAPENAADGCPLRGGACDVEVECLPDGTCRIECDGPEGPCWALLECDPLGGCEILDQGGPGCETVECDLTPCDLPGRGDCGALAEGGAAALPAASVTGPCEGVVGCR